MIESNDSTEHGIDPLALRRVLSHIVRSTHQAIMAFRAVRSDPLPGAEHGEIIDFEWLVVNPAAATLTERTVDELIGARLLEELPGNVDSGLFQAYCGVVETGEAYESDLFYPHDGFDSWFAVTAEKMDDGFVVEFRDITEQRRLEAALEKQALHDPLTGLPNRTLLIDRIEHALPSIERRGAVHALLFMDVDRFKHINDSLGHAAGDRLLTHVADRLRAVARVGDTVARLGGDEFVVLCEDVSAPAMALSIAHRMLESLSVPCVVKQREIVVSSSIGIAIASTPAASSVSLLRDADVAMYQAKSRGGGCVELYSEKLRTGTIVRLNTEIELRRAIAEHEIDAHFQPVVDVRTGAIVGAEALARWHHPTQGTLAPDRFLAVAEEAGLVIDIGLAVLRHALTEFVAWRNSGMLSGIEFVSVNLASAQLLVPGFADRVGDLLDEFGCAGNELSLEVTEASLLADPERSSATLDDLSSRGIGIALDDYGTGYSPLSYLRQLPFDTIKIDRSYIADLSGSSEDRAVVSAIIGLAHDLGKKVVVEGVEDETQLSQLAEMDADYVQGFLYSEPLESTDFARLILSDLRRLGA